MARLEGYSWGGSQRSVMTKWDFEHELEQILTEDVRLTKSSGGPDHGAIAKASDQTRRILVLLDRFLYSNGTTVS